MYPQTPLPNPKFPKADSRLFDLSPFGLTSPFQTKVFEIVARITDESLAKQWLHDNGIDGYKITTPFWTIDTRVQNFWQGLSDTLTPIIVKAAGAVPIIGTVFTKAYHENQNPALSLLSKEDYQGEALYQSVMNGPAVKSSVVPPTAIAGIVPTSGGSTLGLTLLAMVFFFCFSLVKRNVKRCYLNLSSILIFLRQLSLIHTFQKRLFCPTSIIRLSKRLSLPLPLFLDGRGRLIYPPQLEFLLTPMV